MLEKTWMFMVSLAGMTISAAVLILLIPSLFRSGGQSSVWAVGILACLAVAFAVGTRYWRPSASDGT